MTWTGGMDRGQYNGVTRFRGGWAEKVAGFQRARRRRKRKKRSFMQECF